MKMKHYTTNPDKRASDIATKEADKEWEITHHDYETTWLRIYHMALKEIAGLL
jgi:hypothetical protein